MPVTPPLGYSKYVTKPFEPFDLYPDMAVRGIFKIIDVVKVCMLGNELYSPLLTVFPYPCTPNCEFHVFKLIDGDGHIYYAAWKAWNTTGSLESTETGDKMKKYIGHTCRFEAYATAIDILYGHTIDLVTTENLTRDRTSEVVPLFFRGPIDSVTVDCIATDEDCNVLLIKRKNDPWAGRWALPGGFLDVGESLQDAVRRELREETGAIAAGVRFVCYRDKPGRDPRGPTVSYVFHARISKQEIIGMDDAEEARWFSIAEVNSMMDQLAFDHDSILCEWMADFDISC